MGLNHRRFNPIIASYQFQRIAKLNDRFQVVKFKWVEFYMAFDETFATSGTRATSSLLHFYFPSNGGNLIPLRPAFVTASTNFSETI
jgi:hypothetical protein